MRKINILPLIVITILFTACQPTPQQQVVTTKNENLVEQVQAANDPENIEELQEDKEAIKIQILKVNGHINMEIDTINPRTSIVIDADIISPDYNSIPLVRVKPENFTKEEFEEYADLLTGGQQLYFKFPNNNNIPFMTKEEIEVILPELKACTLNNDLESHIKKWLNNTIVQMEREYSYAPHKADDILYDGELTTIENNGHYTTGTDLKAYTSKNEAAWIAMWQSKNNTSSCMRFSNMDYAKGYNTLVPYEGVDAEKMNMSYVEALSLATDTLKTLDGEDTNFAIINSDIGYSLGYYYDYTKETSPQAYSFRFARTYNGIPVKPVNSLVNDVFAIDYSKKVEVEAFTLGIDNDGFCYSAWKNKTEYIETLAEDTPLLDFERIQEIFENQLRYQFEWVPSGDTCPDDLGAVITIKSIEFNLMQTAEKDSIDTYLIIPVWDLMGDVAYTGTWIGPEGLEMPPPEDVSVLTINAIDGSIINREQGY